MNYSTHFYILRTECFSTYRKLQIRGIKITKKVHIPDITLSLSY